MGCFGQKKDRTRVKSGLKNSLERIYGRLVIRCRKNVCTSDLNYKNSGEAAR